jgi:hypothetical protein
VYHGLTFQTYDTRLSLATTTRSKNTTLGLPLSHNVLEPLWNRLTEKKGMVSTTRMDHLPAEQADDDDNDDERRESSMNGGCDRDSRFSCNICLESVSNEPVLTLCGHVYCWHCLYMWLKPGLTAAEQADLGIPPPRTMGGAAATIISDASRRVCPTCKAPCSVQRVVPIFVRSETTARPHSGGGSSSSTAGGEKSAQAVLEVDANESGGLRRRNVASSAGAATAASEDGAAPTIPRVIHQRPPEQQHDDQYQRRMDETIPRRPITRLAERSEVRLGLAPPLYASASLSHGMFPLVHQPFMPHDAPADEGATEYLSRLLLLLGSFVILCLLVFP